MPQEIQYVHFTHVVIHINFKPLPRRSMLPVPNLEILIIYMIHFISKLLNITIIYYKNVKIKTDFGWTGLHTIEINEKDWKGRSSLNPTEFRKEIGMKYDSIYQIYTSKIITGFYSKVTIHNCSIVQKNMLKVKIVQKYIESGDFWLQVILKKLVYFLINPIPSGTIAISLF